MRITSKGSLDVVSTDAAKPYNFYANIDFAGLTRDTLVRMTKEPIQINATKEAQAKLREKFSAAILQAIQDADDYKEKPVFKIKEEEEDY